MVSQNYICSRGTGNRDRNTCTYYMYRMRIYVSTYILFRASRNICTVRTYYSTEWKHTYVLYTVATRVHTYTHVQYRMEAVCQEWRYIRMYLSRVEIANDMETKLHNM